MKPMQASTPFRPDIQGLRAIAVGLVLVFHIWPDWLPGGYVGVDVFFVISGYLITSLLWRELERSGTISLRGFYARRVRRLLPAASVVLLAVALATLLWAPQFKWREIAYDIAASALYVQNWRLSSNAVDYLAAEEAIGPLKHFWSLAIEEQYYIVWPLSLLIGVALLSGRRTMGRRSALTVLALLVGTGSLGFSVQLTADEPAIAYFATHARIWELAMGSALALSPGRWGPRWARAGAGWTGLAMMLAAGLLFDRETQFPGHAALLPTVGTALVLWAGAGAQAGAVQRLLALRPMQFLGDISYSLYLWHWPLIVFAGYVLGRGHSTAEGLPLLAGSILLAWWSTAQVENRFRAGHGGAGEPRSRIGAPGIAAIGMGLCLVAATAIVVLVEQRGRAAGELAGDDAHPGARSLLAGVPAPEGVPLLPALAVAREDLAAAYGNGCHQRPRHVEPGGCDIGNPDGDYVVVLVGDSHAANWIPALEEAGRMTGARVLSYTKSACALTRRDVALRGKPYPECTQWSEAMIVELRALRPDLLLLARSRQTGLYGAESVRENTALATAMYREMLAELRDIAGRVVVLRDTPRMRADPPECLAKSMECGTPIRRAMSGIDPMYEAAAAVPGVERVDLTDAFCTAEYCPAVVGNVLVWRDRHHFTATYARSIAGELARRLGLPGTAGEGGAAPDVRPAGQ